MTDVADAAIVAPTCTYTLVRGVLGRMGDKWSVVLICELDDGPLRFNELRRRAEPIAQRMLTVTLRGLERDGLVARTVRPTVPPQVEYELTGTGRGFLALVRDVAAWSEDNGRHIDAARAAYDGRG
ncbi:helix-turn-helix domain-containing protein [Sphaerisporangium sp. B11E5]|uniref:winged helix-turn-helix transcriptional regulator n=1 Tax=Sphaerisporangium sp. B11E5 TaxID=3153563 RepID=UPI00325F3B8B